jgi:hypothetical protein
MISQNFSEVQISIRVHGAAFQKTKATFVFHWLREFLIKIYCVGNEGMSVVEV